VHRIAAKQTAPSADKDARASLIQLGHDLEQYSATSRFALALTNQVLLNIKSGQAESADSSGAVSQLIRQLAFHKHISKATAAEQALLEDDANAMAQWIQDWADTHSAESREPDLITITRGIVYAALIHKSHNILDAFVPRLRTQPVDAWSNYLHLCVILAGRRYQAREDKDDSDLRYGGRLWDVLDNLHPQELESALHRRDGAGRCPLHYAAHYGMPGVCKELMARTKSLDILVPEDGSSSDSPLHIAISRGHEQVSDVLLNGLKPAKGNTAHGDLILGLVKLAIRTRYAKLATLISVLDRIRTLAAQDGQTLLLLASRLGNLDAVQHLLVVGVSADAVDLPSGRTGLMLAAIGGHPGLVRCFLNAGSNAELVDHEGWTAVEHASYRGLQIVVDILQDAQIASKRRILTSTNGRLSVGRRSAYKLGNAASQLQKKDRHNSHILLTLGNLDLQRPAEALDIQPYRRKTSPLLTPDCSLTLRMSAAGHEDGQFAVVFPILEELVNKPWSFSSAKVADEQIIFELFSTAVTPGQETCIGTAITLLSTLHQDLEGGRDSLVRAQTLPFINPTLGMIGKLTISILIVRPFRGPSTPSTARQSMAAQHRTIVGGHRGLGQNDHREQHLQLGENTLDSCRKAVEMGTKVLEFDVQVTKDLKPIIYHDFLVGETGTDIPVHELSFSQFMILSDIQSMSIEARFLREKPTNEDGETPGRRGRASSAGASQTSMPELLDRMKATLKYSTTAFKPNIRGQCIHSPFATLADLLTKIDESVTFDVEIKFPMLYEARFWKMDTFHMDLNLFIDTVLEVIYKHGGKRPIFFSSFSPDACIMLALKQTTYPVVFLSDGGKHPAFDERATSLQNAVHFAKMWGLQGVVLASEPLVATPRLIRFVKNQGLYMSSYGAQNDDVELAKVCVSSLFHAGNEVLIRQQLQAEAGLDLLIVNQVRKISLALEDQQGASSCA
jgi:glycerophosphodiester phosphodiesterase